MAALRCQEELSDRGHFPIATSVINHPDPHELSGRHSGAECLQVREFTFCIRRRSGTYYWHDWAQFRKAPLGTRQTLKTKQLTQCPPSGLILTTVPKQIQDIKANCTDRFHHREVLFSPRKPSCGDKSALNYGRGKEDEESPPRCLPSTRAESFPDINLGLATAPVPVDLLPVQRDSGGREARQPSPALLCPAWLAGRPLPTETTELWKQIKAFSYATGTSSFAGRTFRKKSKCEGRSCRVSRRKWCTVAKRHKSVGEAVMAARSGPGQVECLQVSERPERRVNKRAVAAAASSCHGDSGSSGEHRDPTLMLAGTCPLPTPRTGPASAPAANGLTINLVPRGEAARADDRSGARLQGCGDIPAGSCDSGSMVDICGEKGLETRTDSR
ncbi:hypothetical protein Bbelb_414390 [Branchiostoma belcheri]|nr:hypothetical protein Bbelb_414390 [Branchiostoma belcheri]